MIEYLELVTTCVGFADYLAETLTRNRRYFDHVVIVSNFQDSRTAAVARVLDADLVQTREFYQDGHSFNKGRGINAGLAACHKTGWIVHLDADIVLPEDFREWAAGRCLDVDAMHTARRSMVESFYQWKQFTETGIQDQFSVEAPWTTGKSPWTAIGYFQMWNSSASAMSDEPIYPIDNDTAGWSDIVFSQKFSRSIYWNGRTVFHLQANGKKEKHDADWGGRTTPAWPPFAHLRGDQ